MNSVSSSFKLHEGQTHKKHLCYAALFAVSGRPSTHQTAAVTPDTYVTLQEFPAIPTSGIM